jgi:hypothetical protein
MPLQETNQHLLQQDDTDIGVSIQPKGTGTVTIDALTFPAADGTADQILTTNGSGVFIFCR